MIVCAAQIAIRLAGMRSLKDKRQVVRSLVASIRNLGTSVAEVDDHELWGNATIGISVVATSTLEAHRIMDRAMEIVESCPEVVQCDENRMDYFL